MQGKITVWKGMRSIVKTIYSRRWENSNEADLPDIPARRRATGDDISYRIHSKEITDSPECIGSS